MTGNQAGAEAMNDAQRVLVVDDDRGMRETLSAILEEEGYQVFRCRDGTTAMELLEETPIDVVVSDLKLPDTSGLEILSVLKKRSSDAAFILMTGYASVETAIQSVNRGAFAYHVKSLDMRALFGSVRNALTQRRLLVENRKLLVDPQRSNEELGEKNRELEEASVAKNQILSTVSHELKTPLTSVTGYIDRLLQQDTVGPLNERQQRYLATAKRNAHRLKLLIDDLLDISRIEAGTMELEIGELDVKEAVAEVLDSMKGQLDGKGSRVEVNIPAGLGKVKADRMRLSQILGNLVSNACKYSGGGSDGERHGQTEEGRGASRGHGHRDWDIERGPDDVVQEVLPGEQQLDQGRIGHRAGAFHHEAPRRIAWGKDVGDQRGGGRQHFRVYPAGGGLARPVQRRGLSRGEGVAGNGGLTFEGMDVG